MRVAHDSARSWFFIRLPCSQLLDVLGRRINPSPTIFGLTKEDLGKLLA